MQSEAPRLPPDPATPERVRSGPPLRVIPRLDIKGPNLVKGVRLEGLRVLGKPERFARHYYESGADELLFMDVVASLYGRNSLLELVARTSREVFIPLIVGGGLRSLDAIREALRAGADKVSLNTAAVGRPALVREAAERFGSSTIVVSIEVIRQPDGRYQVFTDNGRERTGLDVHAWAERVTELGAGELLVTSVDREGTGAGYDIELVASISEAVPIPVVACGGAGTVADVAAVAREGRAQGACVASLLHYWVVQNRPAEEAFDRAINTAHLASGGGFGRVRAVDLPELKRALIEAGIDVRPEAPGGVEAA
jgi:imidazole glycerol-phosphate synthase subunit HisF